jgi:hypothetical protein
MRDSLRSPPVSRRSRIWITIRDRQILETVKVFREKPVDAAKLDTVRKRLRLPGRAEHG